MYFNSLYFCKLSIPTCQAYIFLVISWLYPNHAKIYTFSFTHTFFLREHVCCINLIVFLWKNCLRIVSGNFDECKFLILLVIILKLSFFMNVGAASRMC